MVLTTTPVARAINVLMTARAADPQSIADVGGHQREDGDQRAESQLSTMALSAGHHWGNFSQHATNNNARNKRHKSPSARNARII